MVPTRASSSLRAPRPRQHLLLTRALGSLPGPGKGLDRSRLPPPGDVSAARICPGNAVCVRRIRIAPGSGAKRRGRPGGPGAAPASGRTGEGRRTRGSLPAGKGGSCEAGRGVQLLRAALRAGSQGLPHLLCPTGSPRLPTPPRASLCHAHAKHLRGWQHLPPAVRAPLLRPGKLRLAPQLSPGRAMPGWMAPAVLPLEGAVTHVTVAAPVRLRCLESPRQVPARPRAEAAADTSTGAAPASGQPRAGPRMFPEPNWPPAPECRGNLGHWGGSATQTCGSWGAWGTKGPGCCPPPLPGQGQAGGAQQGKGSAPFRQKASAPSETLSNRLCRRRQGDSWQRCWHLPPSLGPRSLPDAGSAPWQPQPLLRGFRSRLRQGTRWHRCEPRPPHPREPPHTHGAPAGPSARLHPRGAPGDRHRLGRRGCRGPRGGTGRRDRFYWQSAGHGVGRGWRRSCLLGQGLQSAGRGWGWGWELGGAGSACRVGSVGQAGGGRAVGNFLGQ